MTFGETTSPDKIFRDYLPYSRILVVYNELLSVSNLNLTVLVTDGYKYKDLVTDGYKYKDLEQV